MIKLFEQFKNIKHNINESYDIKLTLSDVNEIIDYIEDYARKNEYEVYNMPKMDVSHMIPDIAYRTKEHDKIDPYNEDDWDNGNRIKLDSGGLRLFDKNEQSVLGISYIIGSNGKCVVDFHISYSEFKNVDLDIIKYILEKR